MIGESGVPEARAMAVPLRHRLGRVAGRAAATESEGRADAHGPGTGLRVRDVGKRFGATRALHGVTLEFEPGRIHALVGGNGSGKSTLIKILAGVHKADEGTIEAGDLIVDAADWTPDRAQQAGIHVVHQDLGVFSDLSVAENLALGHGYALNTAGSVRWSQVYRRAAELIEQFEIDAHPKRPLGSLTQSNQTLVAIARSLQDGPGRGGGLLILDEPTASLPAHEVQLLTATLRRYAAMGQAILYVSHRLDEVLDISDCVSVLRDGVLTGTHDTADLDEHRLIELIVGGSIERTFPRMPPPESDRGPALELRDISVGPLNDISFSVAHGEVVGIAGLLGSGRSSLLQAIFGLNHPRGGGILLDGAPCALTSVAQAVSAGVAYVPENRARDGAFGDMSIAWNLSVARIPEFTSVVGTSERRVRRDARGLIEMFGVKTASERVPLSSLSGGNQQKVMIARWLARRPRLLLLDEPTQGVDVGARAEIYRIISEAAADGVAVVIVASDFEELAHVVDRALVLRQGALVAELRQDELTAHRLTELSYEVSTS